MYIPLGLMFCDTGGHVFTGGGVMSLSYQRLEVRSREFNGVTVVLSRYMMQNVCSGISRVWEKSCVGIHDDEYRERPPGIWILRTDI